MIKKSDLKVGDIVLCDARRQEYIFKVEKLIMETFTAQDAQWKYCDPADVGTEYVKQVKIKSVYQFVLNSTDRKRRSCGLTTYPDWCHKVDPNKIQESIRALDKFLAETFP